MTPKKGFGEGILDVLADKAHSDYYDLATLPEWVDDVFVLTKAQKYADVYERSKSRKDWEDYLSLNPPDPKVITVLLNEIINRYATRIAKRGGQGKNAYYLDRKARLQAIWLSGKYKTKSKCAEKEYKTVGVAYDTAKKWLSKRELEMRQKDASA